MLNENSGRKLQNPNDCNEKTVNYLVVVYYSRTQNKNNLGHRTCTEFGRFGEKVFKTN